MKKRILIIGSYPIVNPQHGGQKRTAAIVEDYKKFSNVRYSAIFYKQFYRDYSRHDIAVGSRSAGLIKEKPYFSDVYCGEALFLEPKTKKRVIRLLCSFKPDVIQIEQPYVFIGLKPILDELNLKPKLILSSQNIEYKMKDEIFSALKIDTVQMRKMIDKIKKLEIDIARNSDLVVAVSREDANEFKKLGAKPRRIIVAPNGIAEPRVIHKSRSTGYFSQGQYLVSKKILFVGSAHPPNWFGFEKMVGKKLGFLPSDARIYLVGGISDYFSNSIRERSIEDITFWQRVIPCGRVSEKRLGELLGDCDVIILPIIEGGGSNLKTAEAFIADKRIVSTSYAMRSYEYLEKLPNLYIADTPEEFRRMILHALDAPFVKRSVEDKQLVKNVLWNSCLKDLTRGVKKL